MTITAAFSNAVADAASSGVVLATTVALIEVLPSTVIGGAKIIVQAASTDSAPIYSRVHSVKEITSAGIFEVPLMIGMFVRLLLEGSTASTNIDANIIT